MTPSEAIDFMKNHKILHFKCGDLELVLHPDALIEEKEPPKPEPELDDKEVGTSGMTRKQQYDHFGTVIESEFRKKV